MQLASALVLLMVGPLTGPTWSARPGECSVAWQPYFSQYFEPTEKLGDQVWAFRQLADGSVVIANSVGLTRIEGLEQEAIAGATSQRPVYSMDVDKADRVYYGAYRDFGIVDYDSTGLLVARSLLEESGIPPDSLSYVWTTVATENGVVFQTPERLIRMEKGEVRQWAAPGRIHNAFKVGERIFVRVISHGLFELLNDDLRLTPGGEAFAGLRIFMMHETPSGQLVVGTNEEGFLVSNGTGFERIATALDDIQPEVRRYHGIVLADGKIAVATLGAGIILLASDGSLVAHLTHESSNRYETQLKDDVVNYLYSDAHNGLWVGYNNAGVSRIDICSPLNKIDGIGGVRSFDEVGERLFVSTGANVLVIDRISGHLSEISEELAWSVQECDNRILISTENSLVLYSNTASNGRSGAILDRYKTTDTELRPRVLRRKRNSTSCSYFLGSMDGIWEVTVRGDRIGDPIRIARTNEVREILELDSGELWFSERFHGVRRLARIDSAAPDSVPGLPTNSIMVKLVVIAGVPIAFPDGDPHVYRFDRVSGRFEQFEPLENETSETAPKAVGVGPAGDVWKVYADSVEWWRPYLPDGYQRTAPSLLSLPTQRTDMVHVDHDGIVWYTSSRGIIRYDPAVSKDYAARFYTKIRSVKSTRRSAVVRANISAASPDVDEGKEPMRFSNDDRSLVMAYSAAHFNQPALATFRQRLIGKSDEWSAWSSDQVVILNDIEPGSYVFEVEARNAHGFIGIPARFAFIVTPPWYRTIWAYALFLSAAALMLSLAIHYRRLYRSHRLAAVQAEELARERRYVQKLTEANNALRKANRMRDEFLATTSHELRTPLTAMLSSAEILRIELPQDSHHGEFLGIIEESGKRLMNTLRDMIDIARLRSGTRSLHLETVDIADVVKRAVTPFNSPARAKGLTIRQKVEAQGIRADCDPDAVERIISHLLSNAVKFTDHGSIGIDVHVEDDTLQIVVRDTGRGMSTEFVPHLFEEFMQESDGEARLYAGTGLGLSIASGFVRLMNGEIRVSSMKDVGSVFTVAIPVQLETIPGASTGRTGHAKDRPPIHDHIAMIPTRLAGIGKKS